MYGKLVPCEMRLVWSITLRRSSNLSSKRIPPKQIAKDSTRAAIELFCKVMCSESCMADAESLSTGMADAESLSTDRSAIVSSGQVCVHGCASFP